jgi:hypothetical protein
MTEGASSVDTSAVATMSPAPERAIAAPREEAEERMEPVASIERRPEPRRESEVPSGGLDSEQLAAEGKRWTEQLLGAMGFEARLSARAEGDRVDVTAEVSADGSSTGQGEVRRRFSTCSIAPSGAKAPPTISAQSTTGGTASRSSKHSRARWPEAIEAEWRVVSEYLNAQERRIIHVTLREDT